LRQISGVPRPQGMPERRDRADRGRLLPRGPRLYRWWRTLHRVRHLRAILSRWGRPHRI